MPTPRWKGDSANIHEQPGSPERSETEVGQQILRTFRGPHAALLAFVPAFQGTMADLEDDDFRVTDTHLRPDGAGVTGPGTLTITLSKAGTLVTEEIDIGLLERPIESHPYYSLLASVYWANFHQWMDEPDPALKGDLYFTWTVKYQAYDSAGNAVGAPANKTKRGQLSGIIGALAQKILNGQTHYVAPAPVLRRTTVSSTKATPAGLTKIAATAPFANAPTGFQWLKTADRVLDKKRENRWERIEEWTGALYWDHDLYAVQT